MSERVAPVAGERVAGEQQRAIIACNDYLRMGPGRSLLKLCNRYRAESETRPPTRRLATLKTWSARYGWQARAEAYDAEIERQKNEFRREILESGLALDFERVTELKRLFDLLSTELYKPGRRKNYPNLWLADVKQIGSGDAAERVDLRRFNAAIVAELRGVLDDLAKETGGRAGKLDLSVPGGQVAGLVILPSKDSDG